MLRPPHRPLHPRLSPPLESISSPGPCAPSVCAHLLRSSPLPYRPVPRRHRLLISLKSTALSYSPSIKTLPFYRRRPITRIFPSPLCHAWPPPLLTISLWRATKPNPTHLFLTPAFLFPSLGQPLHLSFNPFLEKKKEKKKLKFLFELHLLYALIFISMKHHVSSRNTHNSMVINVNMDLFPIIDASSSNYSNPMPRNPIAPMNHVIHRQNLIEPLISPPRQTQSPPSSDPPL